MAQRAKTRRWWFSDPIFDVSVLLIHGPYRSMKAIIRNTFGQEYHDGVGLPSTAKALWINHEHGVALVLWMNERWYARSGHYLAQLAHETMHGAHFVLRSRGVRFSQGSEEAF